MFDKLMKTLSGGKRSAPEQPQQPVQATLITDVTDADFDTVVLQAPTLAVVDFWADWCEPCRVMSAYVDFLAKDYAGRLVVAALDVDENPETPAHFNVMGLPTLLILHNGKEIDRIVGITPYTEIKERVDRLFVTE